MNKLNLNLKLDIPKASTTLLNAKDVARILGTEPRTVLNYIYKGALKAFKVNHIYKIELQEVENFINKNKELSNTKKLYKKDAIR